MCLASGAPGTKYIYTRGLEWLEPLLSVSIWSLAQSYICVKVLVPLDRFWEGPVTYFLEYLSQRISRPTAENLPLCFRALHRQVWSSFVGDMLEFSIFSNQLNI